MLFLSKNILHCTHPSSYDDDVRWYNVCVVKWSEGNDVGSVMRCYPTTDFLMIHQEDYLLPDWDQPLVTEASVSETVDEGGLMCYKYISPPNTLTTWTKWVSLLNGLHMWTGNP